ncbi:MAG: glycosyltransferase family 4 protein, partial [Opitutaceae bacterium]
VRTTLACGRVRLPNRLVGRMWYAAMHDWLTARWLVRQSDVVDIVHAWPVGSLRTLETASRLGIPALLERCNAHTRFAYEVVAKESARIGVRLPRHFEHAFDSRILKKEEAEYQAAFRLLCPSEFVVQTFREQGFPADRLKRHIYGVDDKMYYPASVPRPPNPGLTVLFVGLCAVRKGLHFALEAWHRSPASRSGRFLIAGTFLPTYRQKLERLLAHPSIEILGQRSDVPDLLRSSDVLILPSIEEGLALVCTEAMASGVVPVVSTVCTDLCRNGENSLVHEVGDVETLAGHLTALHEDRSLLTRLRSAGLALVPEITWDAAGRRLYRVYHEALLEHRAASVAGFES